MAESSAPRRWPLALIAAPAAVSIWSGWVGLGGLCGFGVVHPLPGILPALRVNTAITLPVGVEAYGAYALGAWLTLTAAGQARTFARRSAIGSLLLGMLGQVAYHLLAAAHAHRAPWPIVVLVSCMPVITLGFGAALTHLLRAGHDIAGTADLTASQSETALPTGPRTGSQTGPELPARTGPLSVAGPVRKSLPAAGSDRTARRSPNRAAKRATGEDAEREFAAEIAAGQVPSLYQIRSRLHVGNDRAKALRQHIARQALST